MKSCLSRFLRHLEIEKGYSQGTVEAYQLDIETGLIPFLQQRGKSQVTEITKDDIRAYLEYQMTIKGNSNSTRARKLAAIKSFFNYLIQNGELEVNPAASVKSPKIPETQPQYLTEEECMRLLKGMARKGQPRIRERDLAIVVLLLHCGLRVSELVKLDLVNVDLARKQLKVNRKGNKEQYLPLNGETARTLASYLARRPRARNGRFFVKTNRDSLDRGSVYDMVQRYMKLAGINKGKYGPHLLRHTFCTRLHQKGVSPFTIKELAGHKSMNTTMKYVNIENKEQAEAIDRLEFGTL